MLKRRVVSAGMIAALSAAFLMSCSDNPSPPKVEESQQTEVAPPAATIAAPVAPPARPWVMPTLRPSLAIPKLTYVKTDPIHAEIKVWDRTPDSSREAAKTDWQFSTAVKFEILDTKQTEKNGVVTITGKIADPVGTQKLDVVIWIPRNLPADIFDHEETHRLIAERVYVETLAKLEAFLAEKNGKPCEAHGPTGDAAMAELVAERQKWCDEYQALAKRELGRTQMLSDRLDEITQHGQNKDKSNAEVIKMLFERP